MTTPFEVEGDAGHEEYMRRALALASEAAGLASPNPTVGCVLVKDARVISEGAHLYEARDHAEIAALKEARHAGEDVRGATAYVTLEPCSHHGRTGPCADALIVAGIRRCFAATIDPNPQVSGGGVAKLRAAGVETHVGLCEREARILNNAFACSITQGRPFVRLKSALSVDGWVAPPAESRVKGAPHWLTGAAARLQVQQLRHESDAILTGIGTVLADDPLLTDRTGQNGRGGARRRPLQRVVMDSMLRIPLDSQLIESDSNDLWLFASDAAPAERREVLRARGARITFLPELRPAAVLHALHAARLLSVLIEAGPGINGAFLGAGLVDEAVLFYAERELGADAVPFAHGHPGPFALEQQMLSVEKRSFGPDVCVSGLLRDPWQSVSDLS